MQLHIVSDELAKTFADAVLSGNVRILRVSIEKGTLNGSTQDELVHGNSCTFFFFLHYRIARTNRIDTRRLDF